MNEKAARGGADMGTSWWSMRCKLWGEKKTATAIVLDNRRSIGGWMCDKFMEALV